MIQLGANNQIEFRHQLIQEYYTAESLLKLLPSLGDDELKREYLNYLKWTEPLALMLELVEDEAQAVRVVKLALEVDLRLGARLAGAVKPEFQRQTVNLIAELEISKLRKLCLLATTGSDIVLPALIQIFHDKSSIHRSDAIHLMLWFRSRAVIPTLLEALEDKDDNVRTNAAFVLGEYACEEEVSILVRALDDEDQRVRLNVVIALRKIGSIAANFGLIKALEDKEICNYAAFALLNSDDKLAISTVRSWAHRNSITYLEPPDGGPLSCLSYELAQEILEPADAPNTESKIRKRCAYYNPALISLEIRADFPPAQPISTRLMHILHLSDLHFGTPDQANLWSTQLRTDLRRELSIPHLDALILSGDIANYSTQEEYKAAEQFLNTLCGNFTLNPEQIILVPGNHDLNWNLAKKAYKLTDRDDYDGELKDGHYIEESASVIRVRDDGDYKQRFAHFSSFYETIKQKPYPLDYDQQYSLDHLKEQNLLILGLNSAWQLDHHYKTRASINMGALSNALTQIDDNPDYDNCLKIAVWHHPLDSAYSDRITDQGFLEQLAVNGFRFFLHGHIHKAETSLFRYDMSSDGRKLDRICAGTFGAPVCEWVPGYPLQYNLLKIEDNQLSVYTRRREELNGAWKPDARWIQGAGKTPLDYYAIAL